MTDPGLNQRLRQRSRRAGFMIGISMALTIALCVAGFSVIYAALDDTVGDFISRDVPDPVIPTAESTEDTVAQADVDPPDSEAEPEETDPEPTEVPEEPEAPTEVSDEFEPDYQSSSQASLNFRNEPSTSGGESTVIVVLDPQTPLQFLDETQASDNPEVDGEDGWMLFRIEDGTEGWLRAIDVSEIEP